MYILKAFLYCMTGGGNGALSECSNSSWAEMESYVIGNIQIYPPTLATRQVLILRYLTPMGEYQEVNKYLFVTACTKCVFCIFMGSSTRMQNLHLVHYQVVNNDVTEM